MPLNATLLVNSAARGVSASFDGSKLTRYLARHDCETRLVLPASAADATREARRSAERGDDLLFVVGGDGSVRDAALGLAGSETALAAVPAGTVNIWAKESGIPKGIRASLDAHLAGQSVHMDLGRAGDSCFLLMAGVGWDAAIANRVSKRLKKATGDIAYMAQAAWMAPRLRAHEARWRAGNECFDEPLAWMVLSNTRLYGGKVRLTPKAVIDDGQLDALAMCPRGFADTARLATKIILGKRSDDRFIERRVSEVVIETPGLAVQLDGDFVGETPMKFTVEPRSLLVSVSGGVLAPIFSGVHIDRRKP
ncbi:MAG: diacylglycerol kinase family protein [Dehalococcoidia bacterium]